MVQCFAPDCKHASESHTCRFFGCPSEKKKKAEYMRWVKLLRRADKVPGKHSRVCSCHFRDGLKENGPEIFQRNEKTMFPPDDYSMKKTAKRKSTSDVGESNSQESVEEMLKTFRDQESQQENDKNEAKDYNQSYNSLKA